ncbi:hypothetical protein H4Q26_015786 [Puccinia striiformis f. sp. tritici PST-130]|nr:hypothetical protein H4Q26_015786 [Puccinia striiformis f. sp. tritici PST-130]
MPMFLHSAEVAIDNVFILRSLDEIYKLSELSLSAETCAVPWAYITGAKVCGTGRVGPQGCQTSRRARFRPSRIGGWSSGASSTRKATMTMHFHHLVLISLFCLRASCGITGSPKSVLSDALDYDKLDGQTHARIVVIRHGESESNSKKVFSYPEAKLTEKGRADAARAGITLKTHAIRFDCGYTSELIRAQETYGIVMNTLGHKTIPVTRDANLNALNYGILGGFVKEDAGEEFGEENVKKWYGSEDALPPGGETVKDCYQRAKSYYNDQIKRDVLAGKNIIVVAHRHPILGVLAGIEGEDHVVDPEKITNGAQVMYELDSEGRVLKRTTV